MGDRRDRATGGDAAALDEVAGPPEPALGSTIDGRYTIVERLGAGGMAVVYRAHEQGIFSRDVALKLLAPATAPSAAMIQRFMQEAQAIAQVRHPNVISLYHAGRTAEGQLYLAMELLSGATLSAEFAALAARGEVFTWDRLGPIVLQICAALQAAHRRGIVHRDIKPGNCFLVRDDDGGPEFVKVLDFGIAKVLPLPSDAASGATPLTQEGMFLGTPHYAAPEVIEPGEDRPIDGRADQFAVGVMMYQFLTGALPFAGQPQVVVLHKTANETPPPPRVRAPQRAIPPAVEALIVRAMALDPRDRFPSMAALAEAIRATLGPGAPVVRMTTAPAPMVPPAADEATPRPRERGPAESRTIAAVRGRRRTIGLVAATAVMLSGATAVGVGALRMMRASAADDAADAAGGEARGAAKGAAVGSETKGAGAGSAGNGEVGGEAKGAVSRVGNGEAGGEAKGAGMAGNGEAGGAGAEPRSGEPAAVEAGAEDEVLVLDDEPAAGPGERRDRSRRIAGQLKALGRDAQVHACLLRHVPLGVGVKTTLAGSVTVNARGAVTLATIQSPKQGPAIPASARLCVERRLEQARVAAGPEARLVVPIRLEVE